MDEQEKMGSQQEQNVPEVNEPVTNEPQSVEVNVSDVQNQIPVNEPADFSTHQPENGGFYSQPQNTAPQNGNPYYQGGGNYDPAAESGYSPYSAQPIYNTSPAQEADEGEKKKGGEKTGKIVVCAIVAVLVIVCVVLGAKIIKNPDKKESTKAGEGDAQLVISDSNTAEVDESDGLSAEEIYTKNIKSNVGIILYGSGNSLFTQNNGSSNSSVAGEGSGIIMGTDKGKTKTYIITCAHVIEPAKSKGYKIVIQDYNGEQYDAEIVGYDSKTDIGVIAVKETNFAAASFGDSSKLKIGETVYAIGNPGGTEFFGSYTKGMVSAIDRPVSNEIGYDMKCIQHDAAINPGNSGGMLINSAGQIIGINSSKIASTEYEGMGFSIPISSAKTIIDDIIANGYVTDRPKLGISYATVSQYQMYAAIAHYNNLPAGSLIIMEINSDSAFKGTDAKEGDLIIAVNGEEMETADKLLDKIENGKVGDKLKLTLCRIDEKTYDVKKFDVEVTLVEDKGNETKEEPTTQSYEDFFNEFFGNYGY